MAMPEKVLFLDIDGVLNGGRAYSGWPLALIEPDCVKHLNSVVQRSQCKLVLSSSWRYMVNPDAMTVKGFGYMLKSHGVVGELIGVTCLDHECDGRGEQIKRWVDEHQPKVFAVVDDIRSGMDAIADRMVKTDCGVGMTAHDAECLVKLLGEVDPGDVIAQRRMLLDDIARD